MNATAVPLIIRDARPADAEAIAGILNRIIATRAFTSFDTPVTVEAERRYLETFPARGVFLVAVDADERVVGFQSMEPFASFTHAFDHVGVLGTYVDLDRRRQGVATQLFAATFAAARAKGYRKIFTYIRADNPAALAVYSRHGFRAVGVARAHARIDGRLIDEVIVEKFLDERVEPGRPTLRIYEDFADWFHLLTAPDEYAEEAAYYQARLVEACPTPPRTLLELGSGGGNNASHLKARFEMTLVEPSPGMLAISRAINPECEHVQGDMRTVRLGREFDAVFIHDAIVYMTTEADLRRAIETAWVHCRRGGAALFAPDYVRENFRPAAEHGGRDGPDRGLRYLEWHVDPDPSDTTYTVDYALMLRDRDGSVRVEHDRHLEGLFGREEWLRLIAEAGFEVSVHRFDHSELDPGQYEIFIAKKP